MSEPHRTHITRNDDGTHIHPWTFKATADHTSGRFDLMVGKIDYLSGPPLHVHAEQADTWYVLKGTIRFQTGEEHFDLGPGDFISIPPGIPHTFDNIIKDQPPAEALNIMIPAGFDRALQAFNAEGGPDPKELEREHGVRIVGPTLRETLSLR